VDIYNYTNGKWSNSSTLSVARSNLVATSVGSIALFAGGYNGGNDANVFHDVVDIYNNTDGMWSSTSLSLPRVAIAATTIGNLALFAGGVTNTSEIVTGRIDENVTDIVDIYHSTNRTWSSAHLSIPRYWIGATSVGNLAFFAGGCDLTNNYTSFAVVDIYNNANGLWYTSQLSNARFFTVASSVGNFALFGGGGGYLNDTVTYFSQVDIYENVCSISHPFK
jgi:hypothetical protein